MRRTYFTITLTFMILLSVVTSGVSHAEDVPNIMLRVVYVPPEWMLFTDISGWDRAVPVKESENLKYYEATIWEDTASVHLYEFSNDYDPGHRFLDPIDERVAYREQFVCKKYPDMPADVPGINKDDRSHYLKDVFVNIAEYLVKQHPHAEHHLTYSGHGAPGGDMFELMLNREHANVFLRYWTQELGKLLGVIDMGGPCNKAGFGDLVNFCEYARYYIGSDMPNGGYAMDDWTYEKHVESDYDMQYHNVFAANQTLEGALRERLDVTRKSYEYSRGNMIRNSTQQASYLYSCKAFLKFYPQFLIFLITAENGRNYASHGDLLRYMMDNHAPQSLIDRYSATIVYNVDNSDFFEWTNEHNGMSLPHLDHLAGIYLRASARLSCTVPIAPSRIASPQETAVLPNYPNPFNPETWIPYQLANASEVSISIYAINGQLVRRLNLGYQQAGVYHAPNTAAYWDGRNDIGEAIVSGVYFYTLSAKGFSDTRKMLMLK
ncbi:T9SS type A sorting domain-containing protein [Candidatus Poribacteria bacterium]|nr:T9SS type A sorting domain-containing protein [Candidatus Poribacteria bacterium]MYB01742.1 T9SS type A sorting domain-containing protein [Candidatus Poribacteria bacterium]